MSRPRRADNFNSVRILKKEVNRVENVERCSFISIDNADFPPLPKSDEIVYKNEKQRATTTYSQHLPTYESKAKDKDIKPERKESLLTSDYAANKSVTDGNLITLADKPTKSKCHLKEVKEQQTDLSSAIEVSSVKPLGSTGENTAHVESETMVQVTKRRSKKGKKKPKQKQGGKIALVTPEMHRILSGERDSNGSDSKCVVDINSTEEYPELNQSKLTAVPSDQKSEVKTEGPFRCSSVSAISGGVASSKSHDRTSYGWIFTRSFSDLLKATTSTPASSSLKLRNVRDIPIQDKSTHGASHLYISPSLNKEEKHKRNKSVASKQETSLPKAEKETSSIRDKTNKTEDGKISKKFPYTSTTLNMSDFIVGVQSGKIKKSRVKSTSRNLEKKVSTLTPHNMLDSTAPLRKRGKEREVPKKKQLSTLKKIILRERELKKMLLSKELSDLSLPQESVPAENSPLDSVDCQLTNECKNLHDPCVDKNLELESDIVPVTTNLSDIKITSVENAGSLRLDKTTVIAKQIIHSRNFREYCDQFISGEIDHLLSSLLQELVRFQDRLYEKDPTKAKVRRRLVCGLREVTKHLKMKKLKVLLVAPDMERINSEGGLDDMLTTMLKLSMDHSIPCVFGLTRRKMGNILRKKVPVSCVGVFNYEGTEETFKPLMETVKEARVIYKDYFQRICDLLQPELIESLGESISDEEKRDIWKKITKDTTADGWAFDSLKPSCKKTEE